MRISFLYADELHPYKMPVRIEFITSRGKKKSRNTTDLYVVKELYSLDIKVSEVEIDEQEFFRRGYHAGRGSFIGNRVQLDSVEMQNDLAFLGYVLSELNFHVEKIVRKEIEAIFLFGVSVLLICMTFFGYIFFDLLFHIALLLGTGAGTVRILHSIRRKLSKLETTKRKLFFLREPAFQSESHPRGILKGYVEYPFVRQYSQFPRLSLVSSDPLLYWKTNWPFWAIASLIPVSYAMALAYWLFRETNGLYCIFC